VGSAHLAANWRRPDSEDADVNSPVWTITGHAIVGDDDMIADARGHMPAVLRNDADWRLFQQELDRSACVVLGRLGHEAHPNPGRLRIIVSQRAAGGLERRADGWWWDPARIAWAEARAAAVPGGGRVAVPGGQGVFALFLGIGYDAFQLTRARGVTVPGGRTLFPGVGSAEQRLADAGLEPGPALAVDPLANVWTTLWTRPVT
jgi:hypothetical protein